jgi:hypothetical protein
MDRIDQMDDEVVELGVASEETRGVGILEDDPGGDKQRFALGIATE